MEKPTNKETLINYLYSQPKDLTTISTYEVFKTCGKTISGTRLMLTVQL